MQKAIALPVVGGFGLGSADSGINGVASRRAVSKSRVVRLRCCDEFSFKNRSARKLPLTH